MTRTFADADISRAVLPTPTELYSAQYMRKLNENITRLIFTRASRDELALYGAFLPVSYNAGTKSSGIFTLNSAKGTFQHIIDNGAFTLNPPVEVCQIRLEVVNGATAGIITLTGFTKVSGAHAVTVGNKYLFNIIKTNSCSLVSIAQLVP